MTDTTPRLGLPLLAAAQAQKHVTVNEALTMLDLFAGVIPVQSRSLSAPAGGESDGDVYILAGSGTGDWASYSANDIAMMIDGEWRRTVPTQGMVAVVADEGGRYLAWNVTTSTWAAVIGAPGLGAALVNGFSNGDFDIWQRGTSWSASGYGGADRWLILANGSTFTGSRQTHTLGQTDVPGNPRYYLQVAVTSVAGAGNYVKLSQRIEGVRRFAGQTVTLTGFAKEAAGKSVAVEVYQYFGTGGTPSASVSTPVGIKTLTTGFAKIGGAGFTFAIPSIAGKTVGSDDNDFVEINIWLDAGSTLATRASGLGQQSGTWGFSHLSIVEGDAVDAADPFTARTLGEEMALCQRYYARQSAGLTGYAYNSTNVLLWGRLPTRMRTSPNVQLLTSTPTLGQYNTTLNGSGSTLAATPVTLPDTVADVRIGGFSGMTPGAVIRVVQTTDLLDFDAEL